MMPADPRGEQPPETAAPQAPGKPPGRAGTAQDTVRRAAGAGPGTTAEAEDRSAAEKSAGAGPGTKAGAAAGTIPRRAGESARSGEEAQRPALREDRGLCLPEAAGQKKFPRKTFTREQQKDRAVRSSLQFSKRHVFLRLLLFYTTVCRAAGSAAYPLRICRAQ